MDADGFLGVFERHVDRREDPEVWKALAGDFRYLANANRDRSVAFMESLNSQYPNLLTSEHGVGLIAHTHNWLPLSLLASVFEQWQRPDWAWGPQAAGEVIVLRHALMPEDAWTAECLATLREGPESARIGMAYSAAHLWGYARFRDTLTSLIIELIEDASPPVAGALFEVFRVTEPLPVDDATRRLLEAIVDHPHILESGSTFLVVRLKGLLVDVAFVEVIARILRALVDCHAERIADADDLMQCALTLQRFSQTREHGVALFERLIELDAYVVDRVLRDIDRRIH